MRHCSCDLPQGTARLNTVLSGTDATIINLSSVECFDPSTGQWSAVAGGVSTARCAHGVAVVNGKLYAAGGVDSTYTALSSVQCFDPSTGVWSVVAAMSTARYAHGVAVVDGMLYAVGGKDNANNTVSSVESFDPSTGQWSAVAGVMDTARSLLAVVSVECPAE